MPRYFVALPLPDNAKDALTAIQLSPCRGRRIVRTEQMHLTLHFLGNLDSQTVSLATEALATAARRSKAIPLTIDRVGMFRGRDGNQVLWAGVETNPQLLDLHSECDVQLTNAIGFQSETRKFTPHITLARVTNSRLYSESEDFLQRHQDLQLDTFLVRDLTFFRSVLKEDGPQYETVASFSLS